MTQIDTTTGQEIAKAINSREVAELMVRGLLLKPASAENNEDMRIWRDRQRHATATLRRLGVPVLD